MYLHRKENYSDGGWVYYRDDVAMDHIVDAKNKQQNVDFLLLSFQLLNPIKCLAYGDEFR